MKNRLKIYRISTIVSLALVFALAAALAPLVLKSGIREVFLMRAVSLLEFFFILSAIVFTILFLTEKNKRREEERINAEKEQHHRIGPYEGSFRGEALEKSPSENKVSNPKINIPLFSLPDAENPNAGMTSILSEELKWIEKNVVSGISELPEEFEYAHNPIIESVFFNVKLRAFPYDLGKCAMFFLKLRDGNDTHDALKKIFEWRDELFGRLLENETHIYNDNPNISFFKGMSYMIILKKDPQLTRSEIEKCRNYHYNVSFGYPINDRAYFEWESRCVYGLGEKTSEINGKTYISWEKTVLAEDLEAIENLNAAIENRVAEKIEEYYDDSLYL